MNSRQSTQIYTSLERATYELMQSQYKIKYNLEDGISMFFLSDVKRLPGKKPNETTLDHC